MSSQYRLGPVSINMNSNNNSDVFFYHNTTDNSTGSSTASPETEEPFDKAFREAQVAIILLYAILCIVAVLGNSCAVYIVISKRKMRNVTNYFIASLAVSDILMAVVCIPFSFVANVLLDHWPFGAALCPIVTYMQAAVVFQNAYTLLAMSLERYIAIMHPFLRRLGKRRCLQVVAFCWVIAFLTPIPTAVTSHLHEHSDPRDNSTYQLCYEQWASESQRFSYSVTIMVLQYFVPLVVLIYTYAKIVHVIWLKDMPTPTELLHHREKDIKEKPRDVVIDPRKKVIKMMITVVGIYSICWLPLHAITIAADVDSSIYEPAYMRVVWIAAHWMAMSSCAYNPFIYWWMNPKFREGYVQLFRRIQNCLCPSSGRRKRFVSRPSFGNNNMTLTSRRQSSTQTVELTGIPYSAPRKVEFATLNDRGKERLFIKEMDFVPELSNISEVNENGFGLYGGQPLVSRRPEQNETTAA